MKNAAVPKQTKRNWWQRCCRQWQHRSYVLRTPALMQEPLQAQLAEQIANSERGHTGQIAVYVERELPAHYIRANQTARDRALVLFGKLGVWDTEYNNGVLIYLLEAEHAIEIVADRGLRAKTQAQDWEGIAAHLSEHLQAGRSAAGLQLAIAEVGALLAQHFPRQEGSVWANEISDLPEPPPHR